MNYGEARRDRYREGTHAQPIVTTTVTCCVRFLERRPRASNGKYVGWLGSPPAAATGAVLD